MSRTAEPTQQQRAARISAQLRRVDALERHIRRVVESAPAPSPEQIERLRALLPTADAIPA